MSLLTRIRAVLPRFDINQGIEAAYGIIVGVAITFAMSALYRPSYKLLPVIALVILISIAWRVKHYWPETRVAIRPFELGGALGLMFVVQPYSMAAIIPLTTLVCIIPRRARPHKGS